MKRNDTRRMASTVAEFCTEHRICQASFYILKKKGLAPDVFYVGKKPLISHEAAARWRERMEELTKAKEAAKAKQMEAESAESEEHEADEIMEDEGEDANAFNFGSES